MTAVVASPAASGAPSPALLVEWLEVRRFLRAIGRFGDESGTERIVLALFPDADGPCIHFSCPDGDSLAELSVGNALKREREPGHCLALGMVINAPGREPADWGTRPEHFAGKDEAEKDRRRSEWNDFGSLPPGAKKPKCWGASNAHINRVVGGFAECDGGLPLDEQRALPELAQLPPPSLIVFSGNKSLHFYWLLTEGELLPIEWFRRLQRALAAAIEHVAPEAKPDKAIHNPARIMRVPGGLHPKTSECCRIKLDDGPRYTAAQLVALTEEIEQRTGTSPKPPISATAPVAWPSDYGRRNPSGVTWFDRCSRERQMANAAEMLATQPIRGEPGSGTYNDAWNVLCSVVNHFGPDDARTITHMAGWESQHWDQADKFSEITGSYEGRRRGIGSLISSARAAGWKHPLEKEGKPCPGSAPLRSESSGNGATPDPSTMPLATDPPQQEEEPQEGGEPEPEATQQESAHQEEPPEGEPPVTEEVIDAAIRALIQDSALNWPGNATGVNAVLSQVAALIEYSPSGESHLEPYVARLAADLGIPKGHSRKAIEAYRKALQEVSEEAKKKAADEQRQLRQQQQQEEHAARCAVRRAERALAGIVAPLEELLDAIGVHSGNGNPLRSGEWRRLLLDALPDGQIAFNDLSGLVEFNRQQLPIEETEIFHVRAQQQGFQVEQKNCIDGLLSVAYSARFHPIREYLTCLEADESITPYDLATVARDFLRTDDLLHAAMLRKTLIGAVKRVMEPGCQHDTITTLQGGQGIGKTRFWATLASPAWHTSSKPKEEKDFLLVLHSTWIYELAELESVTSRHEAGVLKNLTTTSIDTLRVPYGKTTAARARPSILVGSVNGREFLNDPTGARRHWIIEVSGTDLIDLAAVAEHRDAIWKAAMVAYRASEKNFLSPELQAESNQRNRGFELEDAWEDLLSHWIEGTVLRSFGGPSHDRAPAFFTTAQALIASGCRNEGQIQKSDEMRASRILKDLGCERDQNQRHVVGETKKQRLWHRPAEAGSA